jgi:ArsR family metal-binding transcriptional regulator
MKDVLAAHNVQILGCYNLENPERPLPCCSSRGSSARESNNIMGRMSLTFVDQCFADVSKIRLIANHSGDISSFLPYLNSVLRAAQYNPEIPVVTYKKGVRMISVYRDKIGIAKADDLLDAWLCLKEVKEKIQYVHEHRDEITPNFDMYTPPSPLEIYKLLPRTNCGECGKPTCMAFAAALVDGGASPGECRLLEESRWKEQRMQLLELLGELA